MKTSKTSTDRNTTTWNWSVNDLLGKLQQDGHDSRHLHQLFRHLRGSKNSVRELGWARDLGRFDHLLRIFRQGLFHEPLQDSVLLTSHHLRHRNIEDRHHQRTDNDPLHGVLQNPFFRPRVLNWTWPLPGGGLIVDESEELRARRLPCSGDCVLAS